MSSFELAILYLYASSTGIDLREKDYKGYLVVFLGYVKNKKTSL